MAHSSSVTLKLLCCHVRGIDERYPNFATSPAIHHKLSAQTPVFEVSFPIIPYGSARVNAYHIQCGFFQIVEQNPYCDGTKAPRNLCIITYNVSMSQASNGVINGADEPAFAYMATKTSREELCLYIKVGVERCSMRRCLLPLTD